MNLIHTINDSDITLTHKPRLLGRKLPTNKWFDSADGPTRNALGRLKAISVDDGEADESVIWAEDEIRLSHKTVAGLTESESRALGFPPATPVALRLETQDQIKSDQFRLKKRWVRGGGISILVKENGAFLKLDGVNYRIPEPLYTLCNMASGLSDPLPEEERIKRYSAICEVLQTSVEPSLQTDQYLQTVTIYHASAFSLRLGVKNDEFDFDPILFGREVVEEAVDGQIIDEEEAALLPPALQDAFAKKWFRTFSNARDTYPLEAGSFVVIDPTLKPALGVVRTVSSADRETRQRFVSNPVGFLRTHFDEDSAESLSHLFIETDQFSRRITGVDIWRQQVLSWIKPTPNSWLPESFGLRVGDDKFISLESDELPTIKSRLEEATANDQQTFEWKSDSIPTSDQTRSAIDDLIEIDNAIKKHSEQDAETGKPEDDDGPQDVLAEKRFLTVSENFEIVDYIAPGKTTAEAAVEAAAIPSTVTTELKSYQKEGFAWLTQCSQVGFPGALLADDMGLGKTLQALTFLTWLKERLPRDARKPTLIVAPVGLLENWKSEITKHLSPDALGLIIDAFGPSLRSYKIHPQASSDINVGTTVLQIDDWFKAGVVLTNYETLRDYHFSFARIPFSAAIFDEAQKLKNPTSQMARAARSINADFNIAMTGTPVENRLQDLWSIMDIVWPGRLGSSRDFQNQYPVDQPSKLQELHKLIFSPQEARPPIGIRRLKIDELDGLPSKSEHSLQLEMPEGQANAYRDAVARAHAAKGSLTPGDGMLKALQDLRSISLHHLPPEEGYANGDAYVQESARLAKTVELLDQVHKNNEKALVFIESLSMQAFLSDYLQKRYRLTSPVPRIHGQVPGQKRQKIVDAFQTLPSGFAVMILSPKAGGVGLTLTAANHVIHLSRWWNPAVEDQSTDRVYRIGQTQDIHVYYPIAVHPSPIIKGHSFDLKLNDLLAKKRGLSASALMPPESRDDDARTLFSDVAIDIEDANSALEKSQNIHYSITPKMEEIQTEQAPVPDDTDLEESTLSSDQSVIIQGIERPKRAAVEFLQFPEGVESDFDQIFIDMDGLSVRQVTLTDPYSFWRTQGQHGLVKIIQTLCRKCNKVGAVKLVMLPCVAVKDRDFQTESDGLYNIRRSLALALRDSSVPAPRLVPEIRRRSHHRDFHDRFVDIDWIEDDKKWQQKIAVPRGLDALARPQANIEVYVHEANLIN